MRECAGYEPANNLEYLADSCCNMRECAGYEMNQSTFDEHIDGCNMRECAGYEYRHIYVIRHADTVAICESVPGTRDFTIAIALPV